MPDTRLLERWLPISALAREGRRRPRSADGVLRADLGHLVVDAIERQVRNAETGGFDIDATVDTEVAMPARPPSPVAMKDLDRLISSPDLMPPGTEVQPLGRREYGLLVPGMRERLRVTTDPAYYEEHSESVELWSPGNPLFTPPEFTAEVKDDELPTETTLSELLDESSTPTT